ncbi:putative non-transporter ABC protein [Tieghemostelium lacteum]|uniref:Putative non-transporter ABC protein n=1 Tax=Tieghemostelium lacteum TaxID=361077 RepID=A0A152A1Y8_TIELA|nr:putative non-transporter ABC protein [Tieghemostelium lacteum]|eukprot:KYR00105.1 putative non-transporter ABC protein [Tieghemostelium lacteum]
MGAVVNGMPISVFYRYLWHRNKTLLFKTIAIHYIIPVILELLPWITSKRKIGSILRDTKVEISHIMSTNAPYNSALMTKYVVLTIYYSILDNIHSHLISIVAVENRLQIRRMVMEKLLYSEIGAFDFLRKKKRIGPYELEYRISSSINTTISFFTFTLPNFFASFYAFVIEATLLLRKGNKIDPLIILHPILIAVYQKVSQKLRIHLIEKNEFKLKDTYNQAMSKMISNTVEGLSDIQINNLQETQLSLFDDLVQKDLSTSKSFSSLVSSTWRSIHSRSVFEFAAEVYIAHKVMARQGIDNQSYRKTLLDINHAIRLANRLTSSIISFKSIYKHQKKVKKLLNIPTFLEEDSNLKYICKFDELKISNVKFSYENNGGALLGPPPLVLDLQSEMVIHPGKIYALIGQNRSGKSTLNHILCKLYSPTEGQITMNGIPYSEISRSSIRRMISYVSQRPFIFPGTILDNIRVGNPDATEEEVLAAADAAGVFAFAENYLDDGLHHSDDDFYHPPSSINKNNSSANVLSPIKPPQFTNSAPSTPMMQNSNPPLPTPMENKHLKHLKHVHHQQQHHNQQQLQPQSPISATTKTIEQGEELESNKLVQRVWSVLNLAGMDGNESDEEEEGDGVSTPTIVPQLVDNSNHPILNQVIEMGAKNISGGFAQSIALARIFVRTEAKVVILDEAMSQMDAYKKREIIFPKLFQFAERNNITLIIVTHDIQSIQNTVDHIFVLDHGKLIHQGSHNELIEENAFGYMKLLGLKRNPSISFK